MAELKIPQKTLQDNFNLQDFKDDFNALNSEIEENKTLTDSEISRLKEIANTWEAFKSSGGEIGGTITFPRGVTRQVQQTIGMRDKVYTQRSGLSNYNGYPTWSAIIEDPDNDNNTNGLLFMLGTGSGDAYNDNYVRPLKMGYAQKNNLGSPNIPWDDIYLRGISKKSNGYTKLPNGLIMQWGKFTVNLSGGGDNSSKVTNCTFPIRFVNDVVNQGAICTYNLSSKGISWTSAINCSAMVNSLSEITIESRAINSSTPNNNFEIRWFAIGY